MADCHEMKEGQVYWCPDCGLEVKVMKECDNNTKTSEECGCNEPCSIECCGTELKLKE